MRPIPYRVLETAAGSVQVFAKSLTASQFAADWFTHVIRTRVAEQGRAVLGLATGGTPLALYAQLVDLHRAGQLSFAGVATYNLDEFYPISPLDPNSYHSYMHHHLLAHVDLPPNRAHLLDGTVAETAVAGHIAEFEHSIASDGGIDLQLLGIGRNGHIGFNEPANVSVDEALSLPTRLVELDPITTADAARDFGGDPQRVPRRALTLGVSTILAARQILVLAFGAAKAAALAKSTQGPMTAACPGSLLQSVSHKVTWMVDDDAARGLA